MTRLIQATHRRYTRPRAIKVVGLGFAALATLAAVAAGAVAQPAESAALEQPELRQPWMNAELIAWDNDTLMHHRLAKALGYDYVCDVRALDYPGKSEVTAETSRGLGFYQSDPHKIIQPLYGFELDDRTLARAIKRYPHTFSWYPQMSRAIDNDEIAAMKTQDPELFAKVKHAFETTKAWSHPNREFPNNLGQLQKWGNGKRWEPYSDFQQQDVIDRHVAAIVDYLREVDDNDFDFRFKGVVIDVIEPWDEFSWSSDRPLPGKPQRERYAVKHDGITHEYATVREGWYHFLGQMRDELEAAFPGREIRFIWEPTPLVTSWVEPLFEHPYPSVTEELLQKMQGDALLDEKPGLSYLTDPFLHGLGRWPMHRLGTCSGDLFTQDPHYPTQLVYFGEISSRGAYLMSYGTFDRSRADIDGYENQFKLIRALSTWQNMHATPVASRTWDAAQDIYHSPTAYADAQTLAGLHIKNGHVYAVLMGPDAAVHFEPGVRIKGLRSANALWELEDQAPEAEVVRGVLRPAAGAAFPVSVIAEIDRPVGPPRVFATAPGVVLQQDRSVTKLPNSELLDAGFEGGGEGWFGTGGQANKILIVKNQKVSGRHAARVTGRGAIWHALGQEITGVLMNTRQGRYRVTAHVRPQKTDAMISIGLAYSERGERTQHRDKPLPAPAGQWTKIVFEYDVDWGDWIENGRLSVTRADSKEDYFVDDVQIEYLGRD
ncbi:MAG: carbohydrate binding domain-containing protein [Planctomycetota bacterium]